MKKTITLFLLVIFFLLPSSYVFAKRLLPQAKKTTTTTVKTSGVSVAASFLPGRHGINANFSNLSVASSVTYSFTYDSASGKQGSDGTVDVKLASVQREFLFGTCSGSVCRYDTNIKNAKLVVTSVLKSGKKVVKTFNIKV